MSQAISESAVLKGTGKSWPLWCALLDGAQAHALSHKDIAAWLASEHGASHWWAQMLSVNYEQHIGRRVMGQDCTGKFRVSASKTMNVSMDDALSVWVQAMQGRSEFSDIAISRGPDISHTDKWRYWRCGLADGSAVSVNIYEKAPGKSALSVEHSKLESEVQVEHWRAWWKALLGGV